MTTRQSFSAHQYQLYLNKEPTILQDFEGGNVEGHVVAQDVTYINAPPMKSISSLEIAPMVIKTGLAMGKSLHEWIQATMEKPNMRRDGYIVSVNSELKATAFYHFHDALITEIRLPALDVNSKDTAFFTIRLDANEIAHKHEDGDGSNFADPSNSVQKEWLCSNFRLRVGNLPCSNVSKIDSFTISQNITPEVSGDFRVSTRMLTKLKVPNLKITFSGKDIKPWATWFQKFVVEGQNSQEQELAGAVEFLDPTGNEVMASIDLFQVGIFALSEEKDTEEGSRISRYVAELYVEKMGVNFINV
jgi:hypothetical protein